MMFGFGMAVPGVAAAGGAPQAPNLLADSWQFGSAWWSGAASAYNVTAGQADFFGGTKATAFTATGAGSAWGTEISSQFAITSAVPVCYSAIYKASAFPPSYGSIRLYDHNTSTLHSQAYNVFGDLSFGLNTGTNVDGSGISLLGNGWYRIHLVLDIPTRGLSGHNFSARLELFNGTPTAGHTLYICGVMLNKGTTPAVYQERP